MQKTNEKHNVTLNDLIKANKIYFSKETLQFFGEKLSEMYLFKNVYVHDDKKYVKLKKLSHNAPSKELVLNYDYFNLDDLKRA